jgi:hypothetical protein
MKWLNEFLENKKLLRDIRTVSIYFFAVIAAIIYWGFLQNLDLGGITLQKIGALSVIFGGSIHLIRIDIKRRAFEDEMDTNERLMALEQHIRENRINITKIDEALEFVSLYNDAQRKLANKEKTNERIEKLQDKIGRALEKGEDPKPLLAEIKYLQENPLHNNKFRPIKMSDIISIFQEKKGQSYIDRKAIYYDPTTTGNKRALVTNLIRGIGAGGFGLVFLWNEPIVNVLGYYALLVAVGVYTITTQYTITRTQTKEEYSEIRQNKLMLMKEMNKFLEGKSPSFLQQAEEKPM